MLLLTMITAVPVLPPAILAMVSVVAVILVKPATILDTDSLAEVSELAVVLHVLVVTCHALVPPTVILVSVLTSVQLANMHLLRTTIVVHAAQLA